MKKFDFGCWVHGQEIFYGKYVIPEEIDCEVAIDLGSNVGFFEEENHYKFEEIYAIEASYQNFMETLKRVQATGASNVHCFNLAAAKDSGEIIKIYKHDSNGNSVSSMTVKEMFTKQYSGWKEENETYHKVFSISLEGLYDFFDLDYIDYLKVDIEGAEYDFLLGKDLSKIGCLAVEIHGTLGQAKKDEFKKYVEQFFVPYHIECDGKAPSHSVITYLNKELQKV